MTIVPQLVLANLRQHPARMATTCLAVVAAACVVVWVVSGYDALLSQMDAFSDEYLGRYQLAVVSDEPPGADRTARPLARRVLELLQADPAIAAIDPAWQTPTKKVTRAGSNDTARGPKGSHPADRPRRRGGTANTGTRGDGGKPTPARPFSWPRPTLVGTNASAPPRDMIRGTWIKPDATVAAAEGVLSNRVAEQLGVDVGDEVIVETDAGEFRVQIVGLVQQPAIAGRGRRPLAPSRGPAGDALYVPMAVAEQIVGRAAGVNCVNIALDADADAGSVERGWNVLLARESVAATVIAPSDVLDDMKEGFSAAQMRNQAYSATGISLLAALFIILTTLSMGVHERIRQFAMLRAVALTRRQVAAIVMVEGMLLAVVGWLGGLAAGWGLLWVSTAARPELFTHGATLGVWAVGLSGACALGGALLASLVPAWQATRISPLDAMMPRPMTQPRGWLIVVGLVGLVLVAVNPFLVFIVPMADEARWAVYAALGCSTMAVGFLLLAPLAVIMAESLFAPVLAAALRLDGRLIGAQCGGSIWRTVGTTVALSLGLGLFAAMQIWGYSMLQPFVPGNWVPDVLVAFTTGSLPDAELDNIARIDGVDPDRVLPLVVEQPKLAVDLTDSHQRTSIARQDNIVLIGLDPLQAFGPDAMLDVEWVEGDRQKATEAMRAGRGCVVPDHFAQAARLTLGDRFALLPPEAPGKPVEYTISGIVSLPGWHWMTKFSGLRRRSGRSAAMVFASRDAVRRDFAMEGTNFIWFDTRNGADLDAIGAALAGVAKRYPGEAQPVNAQGTWQSAARTFGPTVRITTADDIRARINARADSMIWAMSQLPLVTLLVTSLGVVNAVAASVRSRRWELGVLRAVGLTRLALVRLILAEAVLIGLAACVLSLGFGLMAGWCGAGISRYVSFFGGMETPLVIPWMRLALGFALTLALCLAAAMWPAVSTGRSEPLRLLQSGRAAW